jgi:hypothetical protein
MSIVPREVVAELWRRHYGKGSEQPYGQAQLFADDVAEWALRRAASECDELEYFRAAEVIRALISPEGKIKGGESDGQ